MTRNQYIKGIFNFNLMKQKEATNLMGKLMVNAAKKQRTCLYNGCGEKSIASHLLQKRGILSQIAEDNHVYTYYTNPQTNESKLRRTGINDAFSFQGYCGKHDDILFQPIEKTDPDFSSTTNRLLFTFRAIYNELCKKEVVNDGFTRALNASSLDGFIDKNYLKGYLHQNNLGARDLKYYLDLAHKNYQNGANDFTFSSMSIPKIPLCISTIISVESAIEMAYQSLVNKPQFEDKIIPPLIINCFPYGHESKMLIAYPKTDSTRIDQFLEDHVNMIAQDTTLKSLSDLIIKFSETWACSPSFYASNIQRKEGILLNILVQLHMRIAI